MEESDTPDVYSQVYNAERPELFYKANSRRIAGPNVISILSYQCIHSKESNGSHFLGLHVKTGAL